MTVILIKYPPHGSIPISSVKDAGLRSALMKLVENQAFQNKEIARLQKAVIELQGRKG